MLKYLVLEINNKKTIPPGHFPPETPPPPPRSLPLLFR